MPALVLVCVECVCYEIFINTRKPKPMEKNQNDNEGRVKSSLPNFTEGEQDSENLEGYNLLKHQMHNLSKRLSDIAEIPTKTNTFDNDEELPSTPSDISIALRQYLPSTDDSTVSESTGSTSTNYNYDPLPNTEINHVLSPQDEEVFMNNEMIKEGGEEGEEVTGTNIELNNSRVGCVADDDAGGIDNKMFSNGGRK